MYWRLSQIFIKKETLSHGEPIEASGNPEIYFVSQKKIQESLKTNYEGTKT